MSGLVGFGEQFKEYPFQNFFDWFIHIRNPTEAWNAQPTYFASECAFIFIGFSTLVHSFLVGGRWKYHWLACYIHGLTTEMLSFWMPDIDNYWHSQTTIMLLGRPLPLHITMLYPTFMYNSAYLVSHLKLPRWAEPMAAGLSEVLIDLPYDIMAVKFVHWTWHDTDPNIYDRHYWVPWNSYYFHLTFGTAFTAALHFWRRKITGTDDKQVVSSVPKELLCALLGGVCGMPGGVIQFILLYHPLHDTFGIHTENCVFIIFSIYIVLVWCADRVPNKTARRDTEHKIHWTSYIILFNLILHYSVYFTMALIGRPETEVSIGLHERTGNCDETSDVYTAFGGVLSKRKYLCLTDYDEKYFDFHCLPEDAKTAQGVEWYTICGVPFSNRAEYLTMITTICVVASVVFGNMLFRSADSQVGKKAVTSGKKRQ